MKKFNSKFNAIIVLTFAVLASCQQPNTTMKKFPIAKKQTKIFEEFDGKRVDDYYWLNQREDKEVIAYLEAENSYTKDVLKKTENLQKKIYNEIVGRIKQDDESVPYNYKGYKYTTRYEQGKEYPVYCRQLIEENAKEEVLLNGNKMAEGLAFFNIGGWEISHNNQIIAYSIDTVSRRKYTIHFKDLKTNKVYEESIKNTSGNIAWANDNKTIFYAVKDETLRPNRIYKHILGTDVKTDELVFKETDPTFVAYIFKTKSDKFLVIGSQSTLTNEYRIADANKPELGFKLFNERQIGLEYDISHQGNRFLIRTNLDARNFRLMETPDNKTNIKNWKEVIPHNDNVLLEEIEVSKDFIILAERKNGLPMFRIIETKTGKEHYVNFDEQDYYSYISTNPDYNSEDLRYGYTSLKTPRSIYDYNLKSHQKTLKKQDEVVGGYDADDYVSERIYANSRSGVKVPISIVYKKGFKKDGTQPLLLYGYGSYGYSIESTFRSSRLSLLDRGFAFAVAHIRGGQELGRQWYEDGKMLNKKNTFFDFIDAGEFLTKEKYTSKETMFAMGGSAGGLLMGAVINYRPDLFKGVIAAVPFVDVITTMMDESIPLTTGEYDEWGNPNIKEYYDYILSYSPYDNVEAKDYPAMLVTTGLHDSQVQYFEPAKWVAKLRELKTDNNPLLLWTNMEFGHGGASGRFEAHKETAMENAFMLMLLGIDE
jgi:oligopeptidase B